MKRLPGCTGKVPYLSLLEAKHVVRRMVNSPHHPQIYHCKYLLQGLDHWHITSMPKTAYKQMIRRKEKNAREHRQA